METEKKQNDLASIEERIDPLLEVPESETVQPQLKKDRSNEVYTEGKGENDMIAVPKKLDNIQKISEFDVINQDPSLMNYEWNIKHRLDHFHNQIEQIEKNEKSLMDFAHSYKTMGLVVQDNNDIVYKEYAPGAKGIAIFGEFNNWNRDQYWLQRDQFGF